MKKFLVVYDIISSLVSLIIIFIGLLIACFLYAETQQEPIIINTIELNNNLNINYIKDDKIDECFVVFQSNHGISSLRVDCISILRRVK